MVSSAYCGVFRVCEPHRRERCRILVHCPNKLNVDGRVDLFIGPEAPKGMESNWIPPQGKCPFPKTQFERQHVEGRRNRFADALRCSAQETE